MLRNWYSPHVAQGKGGEKKRGETGGVEEGWSNHSPRALSLVRISPLTWLSPSSHRHLPLCSPSEPETRSQTPRTTPIPLPLLCLGEGEGACLHVRRRQTEAEDACEGLGEEESAICGCVCVSVCERERESEREREKESDGGTKVWWVSLLFVSWRRERSTGGSFV